MPGTLFDTAHQDSLRMLIGKVLPSPGYGFPTHEPFGEAIRAVEAGQPAPAHDFDGVGDPDAADEVASSLGVLLDAVGVNPKGDRVAALDKLRRTDRARVGMLLGLVEEHVDWAPLESDWNEKTGGG